MDLVTPEVGLVFWTTISFVILLVLLRLFAWKPILDAVAERENSIEKALLRAEAAEESITHLKEENEILLKQARAERDAILHEAAHIKNQIIGDAKEAAHKEGARQIELARLEINNLKAAAMADVKNQVAVLSIDIAEKILRKQFEDQQKQNELVKELLNEVNL
jgi:F-type H+-transporting ATPase subunit b